MIDGFSTIRKYSSPRILKSLTNLVTYRTESRDAIAAKKKLHYFKGRDIFRAFERNHVGRIEESGISVKDSTCENLNHPSSLL